jgi:hypothetical protein
MQVRARGHADAMALAEPMTAGAEQCRIGTVDETSCSGKKIIVIVPDQVDVVMNGR